MKNTDIKNQIQNEVAGMAIRQGVRRFGGNAVRATANTVKNKVNPFLNRAFQQAGNQARNMALRTGSSVNNAVDKGVKAARAGTNLTRAAGDATAKQAVRMTRSKPGQTAIAAAGGAGGTAAYDGVWNQLISNPEGATSDFVQKTIVPFRKRTGAIIGPYIEKIFSRLGYGGDNSSGHFIYNMVGEIFGGAQIDPNRLVDMSDSTKQEILKLQNNTTDQVNLSREAIEELQRLVGRTPQQIATTPNQNQQLPAMTSNMSSLMQQESASCSAGMAVFESPPKYKKHEAVLKKFIDKKRFELDEDETKKLKKD